ncbi:MAG: sigma-70 family RNA polymerase sigma factor [Clostridiales bacterium]|nr:sigma-70 family RNA polymerase sigma factor [Clostridiales bacterium]
MEGNREQDTFIRLYEGVYQDMYRFALYTLKNTHDAEDVVGDAVADAFESFGKLRSLDSFRPWIFKILSNKCKRKLKEYVQKTVELPDDLKSTAAGLDEDCQVRQAFARLDREERLVISMHIFAGYTSREIGKILHKNENTIRSKESRALKKMERWMQE